MKIFKNSFLVKLIVSICLFFTLLNFMGSSKVYAADKVLGGVLLEPITSLIAALGDGVMDLLHKAILQQELTQIRIDGETTWTQIWKVVASILVAVVIAAVIIYTGGAILGAIAPTLAATAAGAMVMTTVTKVLVGGATIIGAIVGYRVRFRVDG